MSSVLISGGSGLVGTYLSQKLVEKGFEVKILSHRKNISSKYKVFFWDYSNDEIELEALENTDHIIHLAGANLGSKKWSAKRKREIIDSRVASAEFLYKTISQNSYKIKSFVSSSAVGIYGSQTSQSIFVESDPSAKDFLGQICSQWEKAADLFEKSAIRTVKLRISLVLANEGPLSKIMFPVKIGVGSALGSGDQYMPWVHIDDLCNAFIMSVEDEKLSGAYNIAAAEHVTNLEFTKTLASVLKKPLFLPKVPSFVLKAILGEMSAIVLNGSRVSSQKLISAGFKFKFQSLEKALQDILKVH